MRRSTPTPRRGAAAALPLLVLLTLPSPARATTDGGQSVRLLAVAGKAARYAVAAEESVQAACGQATCKVFLIRVGQATATRERVLVVKPGKGGVDLSDADLRKRFIRSLPRALARDLDATWDPVARLTLIVPKAGYAVPGWGTLQPALRTTAPAPTCWDPACVACTTSRGRQHCTRVKPPVTPADGGQPCACEAGPVAFDLALTFTPESGKPARIEGGGMRLTADPTTFGQNQMAGCRGASCITLGLDVKVYLTPAAELVLVGAATHAPQANGTFLPLFAAVRLAR